MGCVGLTSARRKYDSATSTHTFGLGTSACTVAPHRAHLWGAASLSIFGHLRVAPPRWIVRPLFREVEPERHGDGHLVTRERDGDESLAIGVFADLPAVLMRDANRVGPLLQDRRVVDDEVSIFSAAIGSMLF